MHRIYYITYAGLKRFWEALQIHTNIHIHWLWPQAPASVYINGDLSRDSTTVGDGRRALQLAHN